MKLTERLKQYYRPLEIQDSTPSPLPIVGAALVIYSIFQYAYIIYPVQAGNFDWEFRVINALVDNAFTPILGIALFLFGSTIEMPLWRLIGSRILTWLSIVLALSFILLIPLAVNDGLRLGRVMSSQMATAENVSRTQLDKVRKALDSATTMQELEVLTTVLNLTPSMEQRDKQMPSDSFVARREWLWETIRSNQKRILENAKDVYTANRITLRKDVTKATFGCAFMGTVFGYFFFAFKNVRKKHRILEEDE
ncbi:MAG: HpsJ-like protein, cyanoexosortase A-associated [Puniceicoccales bacterium]